MRIKTMLLLTLLAGMAEAAEPVLPEALTVGWTQGPDALAQTSYCVPDMTQQKLDDIRRRAFNSIIVQYQRTPKSPYLVVQGDRFACFDRNGPGKPVLPPKVFAKALRINGASPETADALHRSLAGQMASRGVAEALLKFANGNAVEVTYIVVEDAPAEFFFTTNFVKAGEYDESRYRYVAGPIKSFSTTSYGGRRAFAFLQDELAPRPLRGEHLVAKGNGQTAGYAFEGTRWRWSPSTDSTITLAPNGVLDFNPTQGRPAAGTWQVEGDALYFHYGRVYGSAILEGDNKLAVAFRTPASGEDSERRWEATLERD